MKKMKELKRANWQLQNSHRDVKYSIGNTVNNRITMYGARWVLEILGEHFVKYDHHTTMLYT